MLQRLIAGSRFGIAARAGTCEHSRSDQPRTVWLWRPFYRAWRDEIPPALTSLEVKGARAAAGLRTSAAHARWDEIKLGDVDPVIQFTRELMSAHLS